MPKCVWEALFGISTTGRAAPSYAPIANLESFELSIDGTVQDWYSLGGSGFASNLVTAKKISFPCTAKVTPEDIGNAYIQSKMLAMGAAAQTCFQLTFPSGATLSGNCNINVTKGLGASEDVDPMEFEIIVDGPPTFVAAGTLPLMTFVTTDAVTAGATKITSVSPTLTGGNSYVYKLNSPLPALGENLTGKNWVAYTLAADMPAANGWTVTLVEVTAGLVVVKGGTAAAIVV